MHLESNKSMLMLLLITKLNPNPLFCFKKEKRMGKTIQYKLKVSTTHLATVPIHATSTPHLKINVANKVFAAMVTMNTKHSKAAQSPKVEPNEEDRHI
jgi:hypothetical protein